jgi:alkylation response protein AidB-like acyl-CoA dehydrogenase
MDLRPSAEDEAIRQEVRDFLEESLGGEFAEVRGRGGPGDEHALVDERRAWERHLAAHRWTCIGWPEEHGGRGLPLHQQVVFHEEYARARGPGRLGHIGETLLGPTLIAHGTEEQRRRFLPPIAAGEELWCQGYSEPDAGSDLANVQTRADLIEGPEGEQWSIHGQKVWTSLAQWADWCFLLARTDRAAARHAGLSYLLVPMRQPGVEVRPIHQITGDSEFNEVFFSDARTSGHHVVGEVGDGWRVAMGTLGFERGASTLGQNLAFVSEWEAVVDQARRAGRTAEPVVRQHLASLWIRLQLMRLNAQRIMVAGAETSGAVLVTKLFWAGLHRDLGEVGVDVLGPAATVHDDPERSRLQRLFLFSRSDTIYGGSDEIQRNVIGERALGLPKEPR